MSSPANTRLVLSCMVIHWFLDMPMYVAQPLPRQYKPGDQRRYDGQLPVLQRMGHSAPDWIITKPAHPEFTGVVISTSLDILRSKRDFKIHAIVNQNIIRFPHADKCDMRNFRIVTGDVRVPLFSLFAETGMNSSNMCTCRSSLSFLFISDRDR